MPVIAIIGCGGISRFHQRAFAETGTRVALACDPRAAAAEEVARRFGAATATDWQEAVRHPAIDTVVCCTPSPLHFPVVQAALAAGKHVVCEKTLTVSEADSLALLRQAEGCGRQLYTSYMKRFFPATIKARELLPRLGRIAGVHIRTHQLGPCDLLGGEDHPFFLPAAGNPSGIRQMSGGGVLVCAGSHMLDLLLHLVGKPVEAYGRSWVRQDADVDYTTHGLLSYADGCVAHLDCTWHHHTRIGFEGRGWDESFEIVGSAGRLILRFPVWDQPERAAARLEWYDESAGAWTSFAFDSICPFGAAERHFLACIGDGRQSTLMDRAAGYRVDALIAALTRSAATAAPVRLAWQDA
jgi:predicted dehydrogenase